jgi:hypothetical protein
MTPINIDPIPRPHLPRPVHIGADETLTLVLDQDESCLIQSLLRERGWYIEPIPGTQPDAAPVYGIVRPAEAIRAAS